MYSYYMHGIEERQDDQISRALISNFDRCSEEVQNKDAQTLTRTTRISLTIRRVEKTSKLQIGMSNK
jgi:hypothetical protein